MKEVVLLNNAL